MVQFLGGSGGPEIESMDSQFLLHNRFHWIAVVYVMESVEKGREYRKMKVELQLQKESKLQIVVKVLEYY